MSGFPLLSFEQANPVLSGVSAVQKLMQQQLLNRNQQMANKYQEPTLLEALHNARNTNALGDVNVQYAPNMAKANLASILAGTGLTNAETTGRNLQNQFYPEVTKANLASVLANTGLTTANTTHQNLENQFVPFDKYLNAQKINKENSRFGAAYQQQKALSSMSPAARDKWIADNQAEYSQMLTDLGNKEGGQPIVSDAVLEKFFPNMGLTNKPPIPQQLPLSNQQIETLKAVYGNGQPGQQQPVNPGMQPGGFYADDEITGEMKSNPLVAQLLQASAQQQPDQQAGGNNLPAYAPNPPGQKFKNPTPEQVQGLKDANNMAANNALTTAATRRQLEGAQQVQTILNDPAFNQRAKNASLYAGALGRGKAAADALSQQNPKTYEDYLTFMNQDLTWLQNRIKTLDGMGSTDSQRQELHNAIEKTLNGLTSNPEQFMTQLQGLKNTLDTVSKGVSASAQPLGGTDRMNMGGNQNSESSNMPSQTDLEHTAKLRGISVEEVKRKLGIK